MPVAIPVGAKADESSFKEVADAAEAFFKASGEDVGKAFAEELADGLQSSEKLVQRSAKKVADSYDKVADATGKVRVEQEKLNQLQASGARQDRIVTQTERLVKARRDESRAIRQTIGDLKDYERQAEDAGRAAHGAFGRGFGAGFGRSHVGSFFSDLKSEAQSSGSMAGVLAGRAMGAALTTSLAAATAGVAAVVGGIGYTLTKGFQRYEAIDAAKQRLDNLNRTLAATGKAEINVKAVLDTANDVVQGTPFSLPDAFAISTQALSSNTGDLKRFLTDVADAAGFAGGNIADIGQAFLKIANTGKLSMEEVQNQFRDIPIQPWLAETLGVTGPQLSKMISDGKIGLEELLRTVEQHANGFAKAAGDSLQGSIENAQTAVARLGAKFLGALFGQPTDDANTLKEAVDAITGKLDQMGKWVDAHQGDIRKLFDDGVHAAEALAGAVGFVVDHITAVGVAAGIAVGGFVAWKSVSGVVALMESLTAIDTMLNTTLAASAARGAAGISAAFAPLLGVLAPIAAIAGTGYAAYRIIDRGRQSDAQMRKFDADNDALLQGNGITPGVAGSSLPQPAPDSGAIFGQGTGPSLPDAPSGYGGLFGDTDDDVTTPNVPMPTTPGAPATIAGDAAPGPAGAPILPAPGLAGDDDGKGGKGKKGSEPPPYFDPSQWSLAAKPVAGTSLAPTDDTRILSARERVEEARLRLLELESKENVAQSALVSANNNVLQAERGLREAELAAAQSHEKALKDHTGAMEQLGAKIDQDFGISKGLPGIAENLTKFLANLAMAPALGALQAVVTASGINVRGGAAAGVGGIGIGGLGLGAAGGYGGNVGAMMALAQSASGRTKYAPASDLVNGLADCSGSISDLVEMLQTGRTTPGRLFTTTDFATDAGAARFGFRPGSMPGALNIGVTPLPGQSGHMAATLPNGVNFEGGGGTGGGAQYGGSATGADDPQFSKRYYLPVGPAPSAASSVIGGDGASLPMGLPAAGLGASPGPGIGGGGGMGVPGSFAPPPQMSPFGALGAGPSAPVGLAPSVGAGGEGFQGISGLPMDALMMGTMALGPMGIAAQKGIQLTNRAIGYVGQLAGIGVQGLLNTFLPRESPLADIGNSWFGRIASGFAGARPAGQNMAGVSAMPSPEAAQAKAGIGQGGQQGGNTTTINNTVNQNNYDRDADAKAREATAATLGMMQNSPAGKR